MLTLLCSLFLALLVGLITYKTLPVSALIILLLVIVVISHLMATLLLRLYAKKVNLHLQVLMQELQNELMSMQQRMMYHPTGSQQQMMNQLKNKQNAGLDKLIQALDMFKPMYLWSFFMKKQVNTMKMGFLFQQGKFEEVDKLLPKCFIVDPQSASIKLVRMYKNHDEKLDKFYQSKVKFMRPNENNTIFFATYSWILVKEKKYEEAIKVLQTGKQKTYNNSILEKNRECLVNKKEKQFSNAGLQEQWYALMLEQPKAIRQTQQQRYR